MELIFDLGVGMFALRKPNLVAPQIKLLPSSLGPLDSSQNLMKVWPLRESLDATKFGCEQTFIKLSAAEQIW